MQVFQWRPEIDFRMDSDAASVAATADSPFPGSSQDVDGHSINDHQTVIDPKRPVAITAYVFPFLSCVFLGIVSFLFIISPTRPQVVSSLDN